MSETLLKFQKNINKEGRDHEEILNIDPARRELFLEEISAIEAKINKDTSQGIKHKNSELYIKAILLNSISSIEELVFVTTVIGAHMGSKLQMEIFHKAIKDSILFMNKKKGD